MGLRVGIETVLVFRICTGTSFTLMHGVIRIRVAALFGLLVRRIRLIRLIGRLDLELHRIGHVLGQREAVPERHCHRTGSDIIGLGRHFGINIRPVTRNHRNARRNLTRLLVILKQRVGVVGQGIDDTHLAIRLRRGRGDDLAEVLEHLSQLTGSGLRVSLNQLVLDRGGLVVIFTRGQRFQRRDPTSSWAERMIVQFIIASANRVSLRIHVHRRRHVDANIKYVPASFRQLFTSDHRSVIYGTGGIVIVTCLQAKHTAAVDVSLFPTFFTGVAIGKEHDILGRARPCADIAYLLKTLLPMGSTVSGQPVNDLIEVGLRRQH